MPKNVWKDDKYTDTIFSGILNFHIFKNGVETQSGVMEPFSAGGRYVDIYLNRYAQPYLKSVFPGIDNGVVPDPDASGLFVMTYGGNGTTGSVITSEVYVNGYAGDFKEDMWEPIDGKADPRQKLYITQYSDSAKTREVYTSCEGYCQGCCGKYIKLEPKLARPGRNNEYIYYCYASDSGETAFDIYDTNLPIVKGERVPIRCWTADPDYPDGKPNWDMWNYVDTSSGGDVENMLTKGYNEAIPAYGYVHIHSLTGQYNNNGSFGIRLKRNDTGEDRWCYIDFYEESEICYEPNYNCHYFRLWIYQYKDDELPVG